MYNLSSEKNLGQVRLTETKEAGQSIFLANSSDTNARWVKGKEKKSFGKDTFRDEEKEKDNENKDEDK